MKTSEYLQEWSRDNCVGVRIKQPSLTRRRLAGNFTWRHGINPRAVFGHAGVNARVVRIGTAVAPANHSLQSHPIHVLTQVKAADEGTTAVILEWQEKLHTRVTNLNE